MGILGRMAPECIKSPARKLWWAYRHATWQERALPDFIIIGAQKSGTTSLFFYLSQHPQLIPSRGKEVHFFDGGLNPQIDNFNLGEPWYRSHFPLRATMRNQCKTFEASPLYIFNPLVAERMSDMLPEVRIVALLRNPTERAISHYFHSKHHGREPLTLVEALDAEENRLKRAIEQKDYRNAAFLHHSYKRRGFYYEQLARFERHFAWDQMLILSSEKFFKYPQNCLRQIFDFVGVDPSFDVTGLRPYNVSSNKTSVDAKVYRELEESFCSHNSSLYELVGTNFGW